MNRVQSLLNDGIAPTFTDSVDKRRFFDELLTQTFAEDHTEEQGKNLETFFKCLTFKERIHLWDLAQNTHNDTVSKDQSKSASLTPRLIWFWKYVIHLLLGAFDAEPPAPAVVKHVKESDYTTVATVDDAYKEGVTEGLRRCRSHS